jgi:hypothetical protein
MVGSTRWEHDIAGKWLQSFLSSNSYSGVDALQDSDKRARAAATAADGAPLGRKSEALTAAADAGVSDSRELPQNAAH